MEQMGELRKEEEKTRVMYEVVAWVSGITMVAVLVYGLVTALLSGIDVVGVSLVNVEFPFTFMAKPVTYLSVASVTFFYSSLQIWQNRIARMSLFRLSFVQLFAIVVAVSSAYEVLYNFMLWGAFLSNQLLTSSIHALNLVNSIDTPGPVPWNLVFATKIFFSTFVISGYAVYFLRRIHRSNGV
ncbi:MAG: hypothetical protein JRN09_06015 [Nitrososphaerota archaeon]|jgi:hypothetical protein|nr:hypothetical protein [Nitrososphaerota archaeon]